jgi:hypothetical protein
MPDAPTQPRSDWSSLLPVEDYRFHIGVRPGNPAEYFAPTANRAALLAERQHWLTTAPSRHAALLPDGVDLLDETIDLARAWGTIGDPSPISALPTHDSWPRCLALGQLWEPDYLLLRPDATGQLILLGGCVCFPSAWSLEEKLGHPLDFIHSAVPGLNASIGKSINAFLSRMKPGSAWLRSNWGLTRSPELNQHPDLPWPRLALPVQLTDVWLRSENQILVPLPRTGGLLFGIRLEVHPLAELVKVPNAVQGLRQGLETMPEAMTVYKGIAPVRAALLELLKA